MSKLQKAAAIQRLIARENNTGCCSIPFGETDAEALAMLAALENRWAAGKPALFSPEQIDVEVENA
jgi:hypothetical protein